MKEAKKILSCIAAICIAFTGVQTMTFADEADAVQTEYESVETLTEIAEEEIIQQSESLQLYSDNTQLNLASIGSDYFPADFPSATYTTINSYNFDSSVGKLTSEFTHKGGSGQNDRSVDSTTYYGNSGSSARIELRAASHRQMITGLVDTSTIQSGKRYRMSVMIKLDESSVLTTAKAMLLPYDTPTSNSPSVPPEEYQCYTVSSDRWTKLAVEFDGGKYQSGSATVSFALDSNASSITPETLLIYYLDNFTFEEVRYTYREYNFDKADFVPHYILGPADSLSFAAGADENSGNAVLAELTEEGYILTDNMLSGMGLSAGNNVAFTLKVKPQTDAEFSAAITAGGAVKLQSEPIAATGGEWNTLRYEFVVNDEIAAQNNLGATAIKLTADSDVNVYIDDLKVERFTNLAPDAIAKVSLGDDGFIIDGTLEIENANTNSVLYMIGEGYDADDFSQAAVISSVAIAIDANGNYQANIPYFATNKYVTNVTVSIAPLQKYSGGMVSRSYAYRDKEYVKNTLVALAGKQDDSEALTYIKGTDVAEILGYNDLDCYKNSNDKEWLLVYVCANRQNIINPDDAYDLSYFNAQMINGSSMQIFKNGTATDIKSCIETYATSFGIENLPAYTETYDDFADKLALCEALKGEYTSPEVFREEFTGRIVKAAVSTLNSYQAVMKIAMDNDTELGIDFSAYNTITNETHKSEVAEQFAAYIKSATDFTGANNKLATIITDVVGGLPEGEGGNTGNGGGGGGGGGGGASAPAPTPKPTVNGENVVAGITVEKDVHTVGGQDAVNEAYQNRFNDIDNVSWAWESISALADHGIISGYGDGTFRPYGNITRAETARILVSAFDLLNENAVCSFNDVSGTDWHRMYVASIVAARIASGTGDGNFGVNLQITRQDLAVMVYNIAVYFDIFEKETDNTYDFTDFDDISGYAREAVVCLAKNGILSGRADGSFGPKQPATRAEAARIVFALWQTKN